MTPAVTPIRLSDGRELIYFDLKPGQNRGQPDKRDLPPTSTTSEIRYDRLLDQWVVIASHRQGRTFLPPADECPLCPSRDGRLTEIPAEDYEVAVFENRFPSLAEEVPALDEPSLGDPLFVRRPGVGRCEVVCFTADHNSSFSALSREQARLVIEAWVDRTRTLGGLPGVEQVFVFENRGEEIGVTLAHPHGQIYAYPFVPPRMRRMLGSARRHRELTGGCLFCATRDAERKAGVRVVVETEHFTGFVPAAARWPYEVHLHPRRHLPDLPALSDPERDDLARAYVELLGQFDRLFTQPVPYIAAWMQAPAKYDRELGHLYVQVFSIRRAEGKLKYLAGSESGAGVFINDITPERAAARLRGED
jgi:UDPglucose--hexose-1-phosphate uridylyltransferase